MLPKSHRYLLGLGVALWISAIAIPSMAGSDKAKKKKTKPDPTVAVLYFDYAGNDPDMAVLKKGLANMLITDLIEVEGLKVVERARLQELLGELKLNKSKTIDRRKAVQIGKMAGALYIIVGHYLTFKNELLIEARLLNTATSVYVGKFKARVRGPADDFFDLQQTLSEQLQSKLVETLPRLARFRTRGGKNRHSVAGVGGKRSVAARGLRPSSVDGGMRSSKPRRQAAGANAAFSTPVRLPYKLALLYARALDLKDKGDIQGAKKLLKQLLKQAPGFQLAHTGLQKLKDTKAP